MKLGLFVTVPGETDEPSRDEPKYVLIANGSIAMMSKTKIVLSALLVTGFTSAALATEDPESKLSDRYPFLEQTAQQESTLEAFAYAPVGGALNGFSAAEKALFDRADEAIGW